MIKTNSVQHALNKLIWPTTILAVATILILQGPLTSLLPKTKSIKHDNFEINFAQASHNTQPVAVKVLVATTESKQTILDNAQFLPSQSILQAWVHVDKSAESLLIKNVNNISIAQNKRYKFIGESLERHYLISNKQAKLYHELRHLRNKAAHAPDHIVTTEMALQFIKLCFSLTESFKHKSNH